MLFYQDVNEQFEGYTQQYHTSKRGPKCCFIRMSMNNLKDIHNPKYAKNSLTLVVLSGCQWTIWRIYTTKFNSDTSSLSLFYQDVNEQFEGYTQPGKTHFSRFRVVLSGCQWTIWRIYTTQLIFSLVLCWLFYQDVNEQFEGYTQHTETAVCYVYSCFIRMSMNNLKDIHNLLKTTCPVCHVVLSGCQWTIWRIYTTDQ